MAKPRGTIKRFRDNGKCRDGQKDRGAWRSILAHAPISDASPRRPRRDAPEFLQKPFAQKTEGAGNEHDLFGKPVPTFPDHALVRQKRTSRRAKARSEKRHQETHAPQQRDSIKRDGLRRCEASCVPRRPGGATNIGHEVSPRHRRALSAIDLTTHKSDGSLIDGSGIPCLNSCDRLVSRAGAPAVGLEEIRR